jgi:hypothetical protein
MGFTQKIASKHAKVTFHNTESDEDIDSPDHKISRRDQHFSNAMLKLNENVDKNIMKKTLEKEEKNRVLHVWNLTRRI